MLRHKLILFLVFLVCLTLLGTTSLAIDVSGPTTLDQNGETYDVIQDIDIGTSPWVEFVANNSVLDCHGYIISGPGTAIELKGNNNTIRNCVMDTRLNNCIVLYDGASGNTIYNNFFGCSVVFSGEIGANNWNVLKTTDPTSRKLLDCRGRHRCPFSIRGVWVGEGYQVGGNLWHNFFDICNDTDFNGFCDENYYISPPINGTSNNTDFYPYSDEWYENPIYSCGETLTPNDLNNDGITHYTLMNDIINSVTSPCFQITGNNIKLDCHPKSGFDSPPPNHKRTVPQYQKDYKIDGTGSGIGIKITGDYNNVTNCEVSDWDTALLLENANHNNFEFNYFHDSDYGIKLTGSSFNEFGYDSSLYNSNNDIELDSTSNYNGWLISPIRATYYDTISIHPSAQGNFFPKASNNAYISKDTGQTFGSIQNSGEYIQKYPVANLFTKRRSWCRYSIDYDTGYHDAPYDCDYQGLWHARCYAPSYLPAGIHTFYISCMDGEGNKDDSAHNIEIDLDIRNFTETPCSGEPSRYTCHLFDTYSNTYKGDCHWMDSPRMPSIGCSDNTRTASSQWCIHKCPTSGSPNLYCYRCSCWDAMLNRWFSWSEGCPSDFTCNNGLCYPDCPPINIEFNVYDSGTYTQYMRTPIPSSPISNWDVEMEFNSSYMPRQVETPYFWKETGLTNPTIKEMSIGDVDHHAFVYTGTFSKEGYWSNTTVLYPMCSWVNESRDIYLDQPDVVFWVAGSPPRNWTIPPYWQWTPSNVYETMGGYFDYPESMYVLTPPHPLNNWSVSCDSPDISITNKPWEWLERMPTGEHTCTFTHEDYLPKTITWNFTTDFYPQRTVNYARWGNPDSRRQPHVFFVQMLMPHITFNVRDCREDIDLNDWVINCGNDTYYTNNDDHCSDIWCLYTYASDGGWIDHTGVDVIADTPKTFDMPYLDTFDCIISHSNYTSKTISFTADSHKNITVCMKTPPPPPCRVIDCGEVDPERKLTSLATILLCGFFNWVFCNPIILALIIVLIIIIYMFVWTKRDITSHWWDF